MVTDDGTFTINPNKLHAAWSSKDAESGIAEYQYAIKTSFEEMIVDWTSIGLATSVTKTDLFLIDGVTYYFMVRVKNGAGLWSEIGYSDGITVDITP